MALQRAEVGRRIGQHRERARLSQPQAATQAGVSLRQYQRWEAGESQPRWTNLERLADVFEIDVDALIHPPEDQPQVSNEVVIGQLSEILARLSNIEEALSHLTEPDEAVLPDPPGVSEPQTTESTPAEAETAEGDTARESG